jgi:DNA repair/transcription protein MET18/MMS19
MYSIVKSFKDLQLRPQPQRLQVLELLNQLMLCHREALKAMGNESLVAIIQLFEGEKDPRNLMIIFSVLKVIMMEWEISDHAEVSTEILENWDIANVIRSCSTPFFATIQSRFDRHPTILLRYL